jgi:hypothetical protein
LYTCYLPYVESYWFYLQPASLSPRSFSNSPKRASIDQGFRGRWIPIATLFVRRNFCLILPRFFRLRTVSTPQKVVCEHQLDVQSFPHRLDQTIYERTDAVHVELLIVDQHLVAVPRHRTLCVCSRGGRWNDGEVCSGDVYPSSGRALIYELLARSSSSCCLTHTHTTPPILHAVRNMDKFLQA